MPAIKVLPTVEILEERVNVEDRTDDEGELTVVSVMDALALLLDDVDIGVEVTDVIEEDALEVDVSGTEEEEGVANEEELVRTPETVLLFVEDGDEEAVDMYAELMLALALTVRPDIRVL